MRRSEANEPFSNIDSGQIGTDRALTSHDHSPCSSVGFITLTAASIC